MDFGAALDHPRDGPDLFSGLWQATRGLVLDQRRGRLCARLSGSDWISEGDQLAVPGKAPGSLLRGAAAQQHRGRGQIEDIEPLQEEARGRTRSKSFKRHQVEDAVGDDLQMMNIAAGKWRHPGEKKLSHHLGFRFPTLPGVA